MPNPFDYTWWLASRAAGIAAGEVASRLAGGVGG